MQFVLVYFKRWFECFLTIKQFTVTIFLVVLYIVLQVYGISGKDCPQTHRQTERPIIQSLCNAVVVRVSFVTAAKYQLWNGIFVRKVSKLIDFAGRIGMVRRCEYFVFYFDYYITKNCLTFLKVCIIVWQMSARLLSRQKVCVIFCQIDLKCTEFTTGNDMKCTFSNEIVQYFWINNAVRLDSRDDRRRHQLRLATRRRKKLSTSQESESFVCSWHDASL